MSNYYARKEAAKFCNTMPTMTDQAGARDTDINIFVKTMGVGVSKDPGNAAYHDWTQMPDDLRETIEQARSVQSYIAKLPPQLRDLPIEQLLDLQADEITNILTPAKPAEPKKDDPK